MERQFLCFVTGEDETSLLEAIDRIDPGLFVLQGKYVDTGDAAALLADPGARQYRQAVRSQRRLYLGHRQHTTTLVLHPQAEGPFRGLHALDELRSELFELHLPAPFHGRLAPARLATSVVGHQGYERIKKGAGFSRWVARVLRSLETLYPPSSVDFVHVAPGAAAWAASGGLLTYLEEPVAPAPDERPRQVHKERIRG